MEIAGYFASVFIGVSLGLIGGGGSILTVPVLVYLFSLDTVLSTTYSLFVVGVTSLVGSIFYFKRGQVDLRTVLAFGLPSIISVFFTRILVVPAIPEHLFKIGSFAVTKSVFFMLLFAALMIGAAYSMIKKRKVLSSDAVKGKPNYLLLVLQGVFVGFVTGIVGAGGGFLIIPALVNFLKLPMKTAIGTSLVIITINSLTGFLFSLHGTAIDWRFLGIISFFAIVGIFIGMALSKKINGAQLKPAFGWFVLAMGVYIIVKEVVSTKKEDSHQIKESSEIIEKNSVCFEPINYRLEKGRLF